MKLLTSAIVALFAMSAFANSPTPAAGGHDAPAAAAATATGTPAAATTTAEAHTTDCSTKTGAEKTKCEKEAKKHAGKKTK
jgi:hypothetical protein